MNFRPLFPVDMDHLVPGADRAGRTAIMVRDTGRRLMRALRPVLLPLLFSGCATLLPSDPLWSPSSFTTVAVLPSRMIVESGTPPWTRPDAGLSGHMEALFQKAVSDALDQKGYTVVDPGKVNEALREQEMAEGARALSAALGLGGRPAGGRKDLEAGGLEHSVSLARALGADMLVIAAGSGEYYRAGDLAGYEARPSLSHGERREPTRPTSFLNFDIRFVDPVRRAQVARIQGTKLDYSDALGPLTMSLRNLFWRVPEKGGEEGSRF